MTDDEMRIAIAEWCGARWMLAPAHPARPDKRNRFLCFRAFYNLDGSCDLEEAKGDERLTSLEYMWREGFIPDYASDLNAIYEAETKLFPVHVSDLNQPDRWAEYHARLDLICVGNDGGAIRATAHQRCEALLKTLGLWKPK